MIEPGDAVVLDFGGLRYGYGSDTTRTVCVGEPTSEIREVHEIVRQAQQAGVDAVTAGCELSGDRPGGEEESSRMRAMASNSSIAPATASALTTHEPPYMVEGEEQPLVQACASR